MKVRPSIVYWVLFSPLLICAALGLVFLCGWLLVPLCLLVWLRYSRVSARKIFPVSVVLLVPACFLSTLFYASISGGCDSADLLAATASGCLGLVLSVMLRWDKLGQERREMLRRQKIEQAIAGITADGVVEGPKGKYVRHKKWGVGLRKGTPGETKPPKPPGYYHHRWP